MLNLISKIKTVFCLKELAWVSKNPKHIPTGVFLFSQKNYLLLQVKQWNEWFLCFTLSSVGKRHTAKINRMRNQFILKLLWNSGFCLAIGSKNIYICFTLFSSEIRYSWIFNGRPSVVVGDNRRFVSQRTGNLYIAKVETSDVGNYTCVVRNMMTNTTVYSSPTPVVLRRDGEGHLLANSSSLARSWLAWRNGQQ